MELTCRLLIPAGFACLAVVAQLPIHDRSVVFMDEGHLTAAAMELLRGKLLYRDVHTGIFPGIYQVTAGLFWLFGPDLIVTRWAQVAVNASIVVCLWCIGRRAMRPHWAALPVVLYLGLVATAFPVLTMFNYSALSLALALGALVFLLRYLESGRSTDGFLLGVLLGGSVVVKQNFGALSLLAAGACLVWERRGSALNQTTGARFLTPIVAGGILIGVVSFFDFVHSGTLPDLFRKTVVSLRASQTEAFDNPIPPLLTPHPTGDGRFTFLYLPPALFNYLIRGERVFGVPISESVREIAIRMSYGIPILALAASPCLLWLTRRSATPAERRTGRCVVAFSALLFLGIFPSAVWSHLAYILAPTLLVIALYGDRTERVLAKRHRRIVVLPRVLLAAIVVVTTVAAFQISSDVARWHSVPLGLPRLSVTVAADQAALLRDTARFVETCAGDDPSVFAAPDIPIVYLVSGRSNPTPYDLVIPGDVDERVIIERLESERIRCVVYNPRMYPEFPPLARLYPALERHLSSRYLEVAELGPATGGWHALVRADSSSQERP